MLGKLMKYEFKSTARIFTPLYAAMLIVSLVNRLLSNRPTDTPYIISMVVVSMLIGAAFVITLILTLQRFYKNLLGSEGYLMHTLPVSVNQLIWSKLLVATVWTIVCAGVVCLSIAIMALSVGEFQAFIQSFTQIRLAGYDEFAFIVECIAIVLASVMSGIVFLYACMALSMLFNKHRVAVSFGFFIVITTVAQILMAIVVEFAPNHLIGNVDTLFQNNEMLEAHALLVVILLIVAAIGALFFALTHHMLKNKLNLQ